MSGELLVYLALLIPSVGAILIALTGRWPNLREAVTLVTSALLLVVVAALTREVLGGTRPDVTIVELVPGVPLRFSVEPLGMIFALVAAMLWPVNSLYSIGYMRGNNEGKQTRFYICFAIALASVMGIAFAGNLVTLFVFYEALTLSTFPLVTHHGTEKAMKAGRIYLGTLITTSIGLFLLAIGWTWVAAGTIDFTPGGILQGRVEGPALGLLLALFIFGVGKAAVMPVHRWLPAAMVAPTPVSALLHAVAVVKAGVFSVVKIVVYVFGLDLLVAETSTHWLIYAAGFTVIAASVVALGIGLRRGNLKRLLAYSTIGQLGYVVLAVAILAPLSAIGAALHIMAHAFGKITLFFAAGSIYTAAHKTDISELDGIGRRMPWTMGAFAIATLSMIGLPPTGGFLSKWYMLTGAYQMEQTTATVILIASTLLNAAYFVPILYAAFFRTPAALSGVGSRGGYGAEPYHGGEAPLPIVFATMTTATLTVLLFFFPDIPLALAGQIFGTGLEAGR
jgi:multicomponent Na+:H+ antiporter subunit D